MPGQRVVRVSKKVSAAAVALTCYSTPMARTDTYIQTLGWFGAAAVLAAYALTSLDVVRPDSATSLALNMAGAAGIALASWKQRAFQSVLVNVVWLLIGVATVIKLSSA